MMGPKGLLSQSARDHPVIVSKAGFKEPTEPSEAMVKIASRAFSTRQRYRASDSRSSSSVRLCSVISAMLAILGGTTIERAYLRRAGMSTIDAEGFWGE